MEKDQFLMKYTKLIYILDKFRQVRIKGVYINQIRGGGRVNWVVLSV